MNIDQAENRQALLHELRLLRQRVYELEWQATEKRRLEKELNSALYERDSLREAARERKTLAMQLHQSAKLQAIGELAGGIAHDFNNQLGGIAGYANLLKDKLKHDEKLLPLVEGVLDATRRSADLTSKLLAFARKEDNIKKDVDIHAIICDVIVLLGHSIDKRIGIETRLSADCYTIIGDHTQLYNMLLNIALNARDAMPHGGKLTFSTETPS